MLNAMSQGNDGSMATIHASSSRGAFMKLAAYAAQAPEHLSLEATNLLVAGAVHFVIQLAWDTAGPALRVLRPRGGRRRGPPGRLQRGLRARPGPPRGPRGAGARRHHGRAGRGRATEPAGTGPVTGGSAGAGRRPRRAGRARPGPGLVRAAPAGRRRADAEPALAAALAPRPAPGHLPRVGRHAAGRRGGRRRSPAGRSGRVLAGLAAWFLPRAAGPRPAGTRAVGRIEAIAGWTEMLRDTLAAAAGLEQAILATAPLAPVPVREQVTALAVRIQRGQRLPAALRAFAAEVADPTGDLVVAALLLAAEQQARDLGELLASLADSAREHAAMRLRVAAGRARVRTAAADHHRRHRGADRRAARLEPRLPRPLRHRGRAAGAAAGRRLLRRRVLVAA